MAIVEDLAALYGGCQQPQIRWPTRPREVRSKTTHLRELTRRRLQLVDDPPPPRRPKTRADCVDGPRPCPWVGCRYHLYLDVKPNGSITLNFPDVDAEDLELLAETCALDVATEDGVTLERVGELVNLTRERVRQIEVSALAQVKRNAPRVFDIDEFVALEE